MSQAPAREKGKPIGNHVFRGRVRTYDLPLRKRPLYPLSYTERMQTFYAEMLISALFI